MKVYQDSQSSGLGPPKYKQTAPSYDVWLYDALIGILYTNYFINNSVFPSTKVCFKSYACNFSFTRDPAVIIKY
jgi:hypothetical protein